MAFCNIQSKQAEGLAKIIAKDVANKRNAGTPYNIEEAMRYVYDLMINNGQDTDRAVTMASLVPKAVIAQVAQYAPNGAYLAPILGKVGELVTKAADFDAVIEIMDLKEDYAKKVNDALEAQKEEEQNSEEQPISEELPTVQLINETPIVDSGLSTTVLEIGPAEGDPAVKANGEFIRMFIRLGQVESRNFSESYILDRVGTYKLALVSSSRIPQESRVNADVYGPVVYAFINESGEIVTDANGHTPHAFVRPTKKTKDGYAFTNVKGNSRLQVTDINAAASGLTIEQLKAKLNSEATFLNTAIRKISSNPETIIPLEATKGTLGVIAGAKPVRLNSVPDFQYDKLLPEGTGRGTARIANVTKGGSTFSAFVFNYPGYDYTLQAEGLKLSETEYAQAIKDILLSEEYTVVQKKNLLFNILQKKNIDFGKDFIKLPFYIKDKRNRFKYDSNKKLDLSKPEEAAELVDNFLQSSYINVPIESNQQLTFEGPVLKDGKYEVGEIQTPLYIYNNFKVYAPTDSKGNLITPSPVITYKAPVEEQIRLTSTEAVEVNVEEELETLKSEQADGSITLDELLSQIPDDKASDMNELFGRKKTGLDKVDTLSSEATAAQIAEAKAWFDKSPLSKAIPLEKWFEIVNTGKVAEFTANAIKLYAGSNYTDLYHEGWHGFSQLFLTKEEKVALYKEVRKIHGNISFLKAEEILAEDFRKYRLSNGTKVLGKTPAARSIFKKIFDFLKALFGNMETKVQYRNMVAQERALEVIKESYDVLYRGEFEDRKPNIDNSFFLTLNKGVEGKDGKVLSAKDSKDISDAMDSIVAGIIRDYSSSPKEVLNKEGALEELYNEVFNRLKSKFVELKEADSIQEAIAIGTALTNFGDTKVLKENAETTMLGYHFKTSRYLESLAKSEDVTALLDLDIVDSPEDYMSFYDKGGNEVSVKDLADNSVLYAVRSMRQFNKQGQPEKDRFGFDKLADFGKSWNRLSTVLREIYTVDKMLDRVTTESKKNKSFEDLLFVLGSKVESKDDYKFRMQTSFWQAFNKAFVPIHVTYIRSIVDKKSGQLESLSVRVKRAEGEVSTVAKSLQRQFQANAALPATKEVNSTRVLNITQVLEGYPAGITSANVVKFYQDMGVLPSGQLEPSLVNYLLTSTVIVNTNSLVVTLKQQLASENLVTTSNPINFLSSSRGTYRGRRSTINGIVEEYGASIGDTGSGAKLTAEQTTQFESSLNSTATKITQLLNNAETLDDLLSNPATAHLHPTMNPAMEFNPILNSLFIMDPERVGYGSKIRGAKLMLFNVSGITTERQLSRVDKEGIVKTNDPEIQGTKNISLDEYSKLNQDIHTLFMGGYVENVRNSDKTTSLAWKVTGQKASITPADVLNKAHVTKATEAIVKMLAGELATMNQYYNTNLNVFDSKGNPIDMTAFKIFADDIIIDSKLKAKLLKQFVNDSNLSARDIYNTILEEGPELRESIQAGIGRMLNAELEKHNSIIDKNVKLAGKDLILGEDLRNTINTRATIPSREALKDAVLKAFVLETFVRNQAYFDIANLSLASYRNADDIIKRNTTTSTGNTFRSDAAAQAYISAQGRLMEAAHARKDGNNKVMPRDYTGVLRTVILKEMTLDGQKLNAEWYALAEDAFRKEGYTQEQIDSTLEAYRNMDEADAQAYITIDTYRQLSIASDEWTQEQEYMYQKMVAGESINNPQQYFPVRKYQYTGPLLNAKAPVQALHKYSLFPLIPSVIQGTNLEKLNNAMMAAGIDYATYETGNKAARVGQPVEAFSVDEETGNRSVSENVAELMESNVNLIHVEFLKDQLRINSQYKGSATFSTQFRKLLADGVYENGKAVNAELAKAADEFLDNIDSLIKYETRQLRKEVDTKAKLVSLIKRELERRDVADYKIEAVDIDNKGNLRYNLDALPAAAEMEKILNAVVNRRLIKAKLPGESLVQVASTGFEKVDSSNDLKFYEPGKAAQVKIPLQGEFRKLLLLTHPEGGAIGTLSRLNALLKDEQWMNENREMVSMTGVRIPVQGLNSMEFFEVAEFLPPAGGNTIVVPTEMVAKSGSDFDIDKLTMYFPTLFAKRKKVNKADGQTADLTDKMLEAIFGEPITESDYVVGLDKKGANKFKNNIISQAREILLHPVNYTKLIRPIATDLVKETSEAYNELEQSEAKLSKGSVLQYSYNLKKQQENSIGKRALGISAKGNTYNTMFQRLEQGLMDRFAIVSTGVKGQAFIQEFGSQFAPVEVVEEFNIGRPDKEKVSYTVIDKNNINLPFGKIGDLKDSEKKNLKSDIISQIVNGHVDMASDSWIANIGADDIMTPHLLNMIDLGINYDYAVRLLNNKYVREYLDRTKAQNGRLNQAIKLQTFGDYTILNDMVNTYLKEEFSEYVVTNDVNPEYPSTKALLDILSAKSDNTPLTIEEIKGDSLKPLAEFVKFLYYTKPIKSVRLTTDVDTKKAGSISNAYLEVNSVENLIVNPVTGEMTEQLLRDNVLGTFFDVKKFQKGLFKDLFALRGDRLFNDMLTESIKFNNKVQYDSDLRDAYISSMQNDFIAFITNQLRFPYTVKNFADVKQYKGLPVNFVKFEGDLKGQVAVSQDGVINIDIERLNALSGALMNKYSITQEQLYSVLLESQYIRATSSEPVPDAVEKAVYNLSIPAHLTDFTNPYSLSQKWQELTNNAEAVEAMKGFTVVEDMIIYDYQGGKMVGVKTDKANVEDFERYHAEIKMLQESTNPLVRDFFSRLPQAIIAVEGYRNGRFSLLDVVPFDEVAKISDIALREYQKLEPLQKQLLLRSFGNSRASVSDVETIDIRDNAPTTELKTDKEVEEFIKKCKA